jgi:hypothetical protein
MCISAIVTKSFIVSTNLVAPVVSQLREGERHPEIDRGLEAQLEQIADTASIVL